MPESLVETLSVAEVELAKENERTPFLLGVDSVIGVSIGGEARAYPTRIMNLHEIVNDRVGGQAVAVTWDPVCGSAVVFSRVVGNDGPMEFGVSGLLYNSNLLMFDRHTTDAKMESLWSQLGFRAIAGPAVGKKLTVLPFALTTWEAWVAKHPNARAFEGLRTLKATYRDVQYPFEMYLSTDQIPFAVKPLWADHSLKLKTPIVATSRDGEHWVAKKNVNGGMAAAPQGDERRAYAFLFAWYAQHSADTDYGGVVAQRGNIDDRCSGPSPPATWARRSRNDFSTNLSLRCCTADSAFPAATPIAK